MTVVLRSRAKIEADDSVKEVPKSTERGFNRRQHKRRRGESHEETSDSIISDEEGFNTPRTLGNNRPFEIIAGLPCSVESAQYNSALTHPLSVKDSAVLYDSLVRSRKTWVLGEMFELYFTKTPKPPKDVKPNNSNEGPQGMIMQVRDKMQKMCDCTMFGGPHTFPIRLFILKNDEIERKWQEEQDLKKKEKEDKRKQEQEEKKRRIEQKKQQQILRKQERERMIQLQKENKAKAKMEQEYLKLKRKEDMKKAREENKKLRKTTPASNRSSQTPVQRSKPSSSSQSVTDPNMITNLNLMAQKDPKLNNLMAIVAKGDASLEQVEEFKKFIEIAKRMPASSRWTPPLPPKTKPIEKNSSPCLETCENGKISASKGNMQEEKIEKSGKYEQKLDKTKEQNIEKETKATAIPKMAGDDKGKPIANSLSQEKDSPAETIKSNSSQKEMKKEPKTIKKETDGKNNTTKRNASDMNSEEKSMQLTAFQQKYVEGAQLILEYQEYTHSRYMLPKNSIIECVEATGDFIISWILLHNKKEVLRYRSKRINELTKNLKVESEINNIFETFDAYAERGCPTPLYSPMTIRISGIHKKFFSIVLNSVDPIEKTKAEMESIIKVGTRLSGYNLWYQLDAYDDKNLAENLRVGLNEHEMELKMRKPKK